MIVLDPIVLRSRLVAVCYSRRVRNRYVTFLLFWIAASQGSSLGRALSSTLSSHLGNQSALARDGRRTSDAGLGAQSKCGTERHLAPSHDRPRTALSSSSAFNRLGKLSRMLYRSTIEGSSGVVILNSLRVVFFISIASAVECGQGRVISGTAP